MSNTTENLNFSKRDIAVLHYVNDMLKRGMNLRITSEQYFVIGEMQNRVKEMLDRPPGKQVRDSAIEKYKRILYRLEEIHKAQEDLYDAFQSPELREAMYP